MSQPNGLISRESQLAALMRDRIRSGVWGAGVPGIFKLAAEFGVSRSLVSKSVGLLVESGELEIPGRRLAMRVTKNGAAAGRAGTLVVHGSVEQVVPTARAKLFAALEAGMPGPANTLRLDPATSSDAAFEILSRSSAEVLVLFDQRAEVADRLTLAGRLVVVLGGIGIPVMTPRVASSLEAMVREAFRRAFEAGHRRVCMPLWYRDGNQPLNVREWIASEYATAGFPHRPDFDAPFVLRRNPDTLHDCLRSVFGVTPPTAIILSDGWQWFAAISAFGTMRLRIPEDVSTIMLMEMEELTAYRPVQAHFKVSPAALVRGVKRALRIRRASAPATITVAHEWVGGASLAPPHRKS